MTQQTFKVGDLVVLLENNYGYRKDDIASIIEVDGDFLIVFVKGRKSESLYNPNVAYLKSSIRLATPAEIEQYNTKHNIKGDRQMDTRFEKFYVDTLDDEDIKQLLIKRAEEIGYQRHFDKDVKISRYLAFGYWNAKSISMNSDPNLYVGMIQHYVEKALEHFKKAKKPQFKVGDWVICDINSEEPKSSDWKPNKVFQIKEIVLAGSKEYVSAGSEDSGYWSNTIRLATPEEIEKAQSFSIGPHQVKFLDTSTKVGCMEKTNVQWDGLYETMCQFNLKTVQHEDGTVAKFEDIKRIYDRINS